MNEPILQLCIYVSVILYISFHAVNYNPIFIVCKESTQVSNKRDAEGIGGIIIKSLQDDFLVLVALAFITFWM